MRDPCAEPNLGRGSFPANAAVAILSVLLAVAATGWVLTATTRPHAPGPAAPTATEEQPRVVPIYIPVPIPFASLSVENSKNDVVEVLVAARDLPVGTLITRADLEKIIAKKRLPRAGLPPAFIVDADEIVDKRLTRAVLKNETFSPTAVTKARNTLELPEGMNLVSVSFPSKRVAAGFVAPGSRVDILATAQKDSKEKSFPLLVDLLVMAVDTQPIYTGQSLPEDMFVSFAVTQRQALVLALAKQNDCRLELLPRDPKKPVDPAYSIDRVVKFLEELDAKEVAAVQAPDIAPAPRLKWPGLVVPDGKELVSLQINPSTSPVSGFLAPGSMVDVIGVVKEEKKLRAFPVIVNVQVVAVDTLFAKDRESKDIICTLSLAVTKEQAMLFVLAQERGCPLEILLRAPGKPVDADYDAKKVVQILKETAPIGKSDKP